MLAGESLQALRFKNCVAVVTLRDSRSRVGRSGPLSSV